VRRWYENSGQPPLEASVSVASGTYGMGAAIVRRLALSGARLAITARRPLRGDIDPAIFVRADARTAPGIRNVAHHIVAREPRRPAAEAVVLRADRRLSRRDAHHATAGSGQAKMSFLIPQPRQY